MKKTLIVSAIAGALLIPSIPAHPAAAAPAPTASLSQAQAQTELDELTAAIEALEEADRTLVESDYSKEMTELLRTAFELRETIEAVIAGRVPSVDLATVLPRIELVVQIADTIETATTTLQNKVQAAHVELGFAVTKAVIRVVNPSSSIEQIDESKTELAEDLERVSGYPDLQPGDTATIYVKAGLDKKIWQTRIQRDKEILGKASTPVYMELNKNITQAVGVWFDATATVADVNAEIENLDDAYAEAAASVK